MSVFSFIFLLIFASYFIKNSIGTYSINKTTEITVDVLKDYLIKFGYLPQTLKSADENNRLFETVDLRFSIRKLQRFVGLNQTGILDEWTKKLISKSRCGVPDILDSTMLRDESRKWNKTTLTYSIITFTNDLEKSLVREAIREAFDMWSEVVPLDFIELLEVNSTADIQIGFTTGDHNCNTNFTGPGTTIAHAYLPPDGKIHFDDDEHWVYMDASKIESKDSGDINYVDLQNIAAHEIGHAIGLQHIDNNEDSIMSPIYKPTLDNNGNYMKPKLNSYDVAAARKLYGPRKERFKAKANNNEINHLKKVQDNLLQRLTHIEEIIGQFEIIYINLTVKYNQLEDKCRNITKLSRSPGQSGIPEQKVDAGARGDPGLKRDQGLIGSPGQKGEAVEQAEDITISCHISGDVNRTQPFLGITNGTQVDLIECDNYLSVCYVNNSNLEKSCSQIECVTNVGITVNCTYTDFWLRDTHCGPEFNDSSCEMMTISCPKEELVMTTAKGEDLILLISTQFDGIYQYDLSANRKLELVDNYEEFVYAMDYWLKGSTIIWLSLGKIYMCNLTKNLQFPKMIACDSNGNHAILVEHNNTSLYGLAVDWVHGLLFWSDSYLKTINVMDLNTKQRKVLFNNDLHDSQEIAVDPSKGLIFWTEHWSKRINRASMDGNNRMTIANSSSPYSIALALDIFNERVYWADYFTKTIVSADYNGNDRRTILHSSTLLEDPFLVIFEDKLYWTVVYDPTYSSYMFEDKQYRADRSQQGVFVMNKFNGTEVRQLISGVNPSRIRVYHSGLQPELPNKCDQHSCGDGAICLPKGNSFDSEGTQSSIGLPYSCVCADGYTTGKEPNTCVLRT